MADVFVLDVLLHGKPIGTLTRVEGDRTLFAFNNEYVTDAGRPTLSLGFKDSLGQLITDFRPYQTALMPFFSNLLPEGRLRKYLAERGGVNEKREFFLLWLLGSDLPGALTIRPAGEALPPLATKDDDPHRQQERRNRALRFSLAGVQLKFSAVAKASGGLAIPASGIGGDWIVKLPSERFDSVPENEYSMLTLARLLGMDVPATQLVEIRNIENLPDGIETLKERHALTIQRFDRLSDGTAVHIEDFAQIFGLYPDDKYSRASSMNIARVIGAESSKADISEFIKRLTFNTLIGNADMHVKNWSVVYPDQRAARLSPAYDFVSTIPYIPDENAALMYSRTKRFDEFTEDELSHLAARAHLPEALVLEAARETVSTFHETWRREKGNLPLHKNVIAAIEKHLKRVPMAQPRH
jgi:serine/threonine-protein kinase HipA